MASDSNKEAIEWLCIAGFFAFALYSFFPAIASNLRSQEKTTPPQASPAAADPQSNDIVINEPAREVVERRIYVYEKYR